MKALSTLVVAWALLAVASCAGVPRLESARDAVAVAYATIDATAASLADAVRSGVVPPDKARIGQKVLERAYTLTNVAAREVIEGKPANAMQTLETINRLLGDAKRILEDHNAALTDDRLYGQYAGLWCPAPRAHVLAAL